MRVGVYSRAAATPRERWAQGMGMVSEDRKDEGSRSASSIADNLTLPRLRAVGPGALVLPGAADARRGAWIERLGDQVRAAPAQPVGELSGGNQQKVALARLLHHDVDVLLLDEPTRGIDVGSKAQIYATHRRAGRRRSRDGRPPREPFFMVSSYLPELLGVCDRIAVMCRGRLQPAARRPAEWDEHRLMLAATGAGRRVTPRALLGRGGPLLGLRARGRRSSASSSARSSSRPATSS